MKKFFALLLVVIMAFSVPTVVFAELGAFVASPSGKDAPELIDYDIESEDCEADIIVSSFSDRANLDASVRAKLEEAYASIVNAASVSDLNKALADKITELEIDDDVLAVSDLFEIYYQNCDDHDKHGSVTLTLAPRVIENFVAVIHYEGDAWELVEKCEVEKNGTHVTFEVDSLSPFAIVVHDGSVEIDLSEGSNGALIAASVCIGLLIIVAIVIAVLVSKKKITLKKQ